MTKEILYRYATMQSGNVVDIHDISPDDDTSRHQDYFGVSCGHKMIPVMGTSRAWHFRHAVDIQCSKETDLHDLGKRVFYQVYKTCLDENKPFEIRFPVKKFCTFCKDTGFDLTKSCELSNVRQTWNLIEKYPIIHEPDTVMGGEFKPDVLLVHENEDKIFIEIFVTHESTPTKINSGAKIIEILLHTEDDIQYIKSCILSASDKIRFYNFPKTKKENLESNYRCVFTFFVVDYKGECSIDTNRLGYVSDDEYSGNIRYYKNLPDRHPVSSEDYFRELINAFRLHGKKVKNCFLCKYHAQNTYKDSASKPIFCKVYKKANVDKTCSPSGALKCREFYSPGEQWLKIEDREMLFKL